MLAPVNCLVFSQAGDGVPLPRIAAQAAAHFSGLGVSAHPTNPVCVLVTSQGVEASVTLSARPATPLDLERARAAEERGRAGGMSDLAARCPTVWVVTFEGEPPPALGLEFCALLASVALGPILPEDGSTLLGVRSARTRAEAARRAP